MLNSKAVALWWVHPSERSRLPRIAVPSVVLIVFVVLYGLPGSAQIQPPTASDFATLSAKANQARGADRLDDAVALYKQALALRPEWTEGWWSLGTSLYDRNAYVEAARAFRKVVALEPKRGTAYVMLGLCEFELGQDDSALKHIQTGRELGVLNDPQLRRVMLYHEGVLLLRKGSFETAQETLDLLSREGVRNDDVTLALGMSVLRMRPANLPPEGSTAREVVLHAGQAQALAARKEFDEAKTAYERVAHEFSDFLNIHYAYGHFLLEIHETEEAVAEFEREIENHPEHVLAQLQIAAVRYRIDSEAGVPYAVEAVKLDPRTPFGHYLLGLLYLDTGQIASAIPQLEIAQKALPNEPRIYFALGSAYAKAGRKQDAARARATFTRLNAQNKHQPIGNTYGEQPSSLAQEKLGGETDAKLPQ